MALGTDHVTNTTAAVFIPEIWSDEIIAAYKTNLVLANLVNKMPMTGKKGDTIRIPRPTRGSASVKAATTQVTLIAATENEVVVTIDKHYEYSRLIEDITEVQALSSMRKFYTDDAGFALASQVDTDLFMLAQQLGDAGTAGTDWTHSASFYVDAANGLALFAANTVQATDLFTDRAFREGVKKLDDNNVPQEGRFLVIPPSVRSTIMGIDRYVSSDFVDGKGVVSGKIGSLYGVDIFVSTHCPVSDPAASNSTSTIDNRACILGHRDAFVLVEQQGVRSQTQYKQEWLSNLFTSDTIYGVEVLRPEAAIVIHVPT